MSRIAPLLPLVALLLIAAPVSAQNVPRPNLNPQVQREPVRAAGTIKDAAGGILHVVAPGGDQWFVKIDANPRSISFYGSADESWLRSGMLVRFSNRVDRRGKLLDPIDMLSVITLREGYRMGVNSESELSNNEDGLFQDAPAEKPMPKKAGPAEPTPVVVIARLLTAKNGKLSLDAGTGKQIKVELADEAKISIDVADLSWAKPGDKIEIDGWAYPQQKMQVFARDVTVTAAAPLVGDKKRPPAKSKEAPEGGAEGDEAGAKGAKPEEKPGEKPGEKEKPAEKDATKE